MIELKQGSHHLLIIKRGSSDEQLIANTRQALFDAGIHLWVIFTYDNPSECILMNKQEEVTA